jgi:hypothetical protein
MNRLWLLLLVTLAVVGTGGCRGVILPTWHQAGSAEYQQSLAERFDPHPEDEVGQEIVGARPRDYQKPVSETLRGRRLPWGWGGR